jgi:hypothetical protein
VANRGKIAKVRCRRRGHKIKLVPALNTPRIRRERKLKSQARCASFQTPRYQGKAKVDLQSQFIRVTQCHLNLSHRFCWRLLCTH